MTPFPAPTGDISRDLDALIAWFFETRGATVTQAAHTLAALISLLGIISELQQAQAAIAADLRDMKATVRDLKVTHPEVFA